VYFAITEISGSQPAGGERPSAHLQAGAAQAGAAQAAGAGGQQYAQMSTRAQPSSNKQVKAEEAFQHCIQNDIAWRDINRDMLPN